jgi:hypothetical protein
MSLCCGSSRRFATPPSSVSQQQVHCAVSAAVSASAGDLQPCVTTTASAVTRPDSRQSLAATTPPHPPLQHGTPHHSSLW